MSKRIIDACCIINLYASGSAIDILRVFEENFFISELAEKESLFIRKEDDQDRTLLVPEAIDLSEAFSQGLLQRCQLETDAEADHYLRFAAEVDDGEAICLALAKCRGWTVATDDRKAIRLAKAENIDTITTAEIVKYWSDSRNAAEPAIREILQRIERYARFSPRKNSLLYDWWLSILHG
jgi:predicted nucleic acid-binding protein